MTISAFIRSFALRDASIAWFVGAGASAGAGIPTAGDMIWDFKRRIFCSEQGFAANRVPDHTNPGTREIMQQYFDRFGNYPKLNSAEEYSFYFEKSFPLPSDRRIYIQDIVKGRRPSYGTRVLGAMANSGLVKCICTTNFDKLVEDAFISEIGSISRITVAELGEPEKALRSLNEAEYPIIMKLHGDFQSERIKNTQAELKSQDEKMRRALLQTCQQFGMAVVGYSGRDRSIMEVFEQAIERDGFPAGLHWFVRHGEQPPPEVISLIKKAADRGIEASTIGIRTFDGLLVDIAKQLTVVGKPINLPPEPARIKFEPAPHRPVGSGFPIVRLNALPLAKMPKVCRLIDCQIGGTKEVRAAIENVGLDIVAVRSRPGVLAFGRDEDLRTCFSSFKISKFDLHHIDAFKLSYSSPEYNLLNDALVASIANKTQLPVTRSRGKFALLADQSIVKAGTFNQVAKALTSVSGHLNGGKVKWCEAIYIMIRFFDRSAFLVFDPFTYIKYEDEPTPSEKEAVIKFVREKSAIRYNSQFASVIAGWAEILSGKEGMMKLPVSFDGSNSEAEFVVDSLTAYSRPRR